MNPDPITNQPAQFESGFDKPEFDSVLGPINTLESTISQFKTSLEVAWN